MEVFIVSMVMQRGDDAAWTLEIPTTPAQSRTPLGAFD